ncbi:hypothetical protein QO010_003165 [Caulobacter ginsengisoli]|uniref:Fe2OG dioxygenase domain-containing protein n=1 Tax=Caulobacter ginsengisoli TaxID=400775 RepID=A0ABU0ITP7_9CAUL|nr:2OG-Fe(II) oxygenase family protein [Caulobacter ginsengisoli]MDQ0465378.1 hypothetical protein [Caulobacter ginsengisoli]
MTTSIHLDPGLDPRQLAPVLAQFGRLHLPGVFDPGSAVAIAQALAAPQVPWIKTWRTLGASLDGSLEAFDSLTPENRAAFDAEMKAAARGGFCFLFDAWRVSKDIEAGQRRGGALEPIEAVYDFLNSETFLTFIRRITGETREIFCDAMASRYRPGDFLAAHDDAVSGQRRLWAYVLNFTPGWRADWGGVLNFLDEDGHVAEGYSPVFNALNLFSIPTPHAVSYVAPYAPSPRLSITGWVRAR